GLAEGFAARECDAAARLIEEDSVAFYFGQDPKRGHLAAGDGARFGAAVIDARAAAFTSLVEDHAIAGARDGVVRARVDALAAEAAFLRGVHHVGREVLTLRIVAPPAGKRAAFEEDGSAN